MTQRIRPVEVAVEEGGEHEEGPSLEWVSSGGGNKSKTGYDSGFVFAKDSLKGEKLTISAFLVFLVCSRNSWYSQECVLCVSIPDKKLLVRWNGLREDDRLNIYQFLSLLL